MDASNSRQRAPDGSRAVLPDDSGYLDRDGVQIYWERFGDGDQTVLFLPTWSILHSRFWKAQIPYFSRHARVLTLDPRGNGKSGRPQSIEAYAESEFAADALAVLDATDTARAVIVSQSRGAQRALFLAANHPDRVAGAVFVAPFFPVSPLRSLHWRILTSPRMQRFVTRPPLTTRSWGKFNAHHWRANYRDFVEWWIARCTSQPHSTKQFEDCVGWSLETDPETAIAFSRSIALQPTDRKTQLGLASRVRCPVLVIHGKKDRVAPHSDGRRLAAATGGTLLTLPDGDHQPHGRQPVAVNLALRSFLEGRPAPPPPTKKPDRSRRALYISSPIGLGHAQRDLAIVKELKRRVPGLEVDWLAQDPVTRVLEKEGERIHPASRFLASEVQHIECESAEHDLHCFQALRRMDEILIANFMVFHDVVREDAYDLWIGDEAWELDYYLHENPNEKRAPFAWLTDFVGWLPMPDGGAAESRLTADYNAEMVEHIKRHPRLRDRAIFVGNADDIVPDRLGPRLPGIREWTQKHFDFAGYITGFDPRELGDRAALRAELGYRADESVCIVTVGGSGVGAHLLRRVIAAFPEAKRRVAGLRMIVVAGPRIVLDALPRTAGLEVVPYVHNLYRHLAACDLAVVQGGLTTAMELTASKRPFLYFPLRHHFEQSFHVRHRLDRYRAGRCMDFETATPEVIAQAIVEELGRSVDYRDVETDGASRAAEWIAQML